jgi:hypothetical protein
MDKQGLTLMDHYWSNWRHTSVDREKAITYAYRREMQLRLEDVARQYCNAMGLEFGDICSPKSPVAMAVQLYEYFTLAEMEQRRTLMELMRHGLTNITEDEQRLVDLKIDEKSIRDPGGAFVMVRETPQNYKIGLLSEWHNVYPGHQATVTLSVQTNDPVDLRIPSIIEFAFFPNPHGGITLFPNPPDGGTDPWNRGPLRGMTRFALRIRMMDIALACGIIVDEGARERAALLARMPEFAAADGVVAQEPDDISNYMDIYSEDPDSPWMMEIISRQVVDQPIAILGTNLDKVIKKPSGESETIGLMFKIMRMHIVLSLTRKDFKRACVEHVVKTAQQETALSGALAALADPEFEPNQ